MKRNRLNVKKQTTKKISLNLNKKSINKNVELKMNGKADRNKLRMPDYNHKSSLKSESNNTVNVDLTFEKKYVKEDCEYDTVIIITTYNRYDYLCELLNQIYIQKTKYKFKVIVVNDGSDDIRYNTLINNYSNLEHIENEKNNGKYLYWKTINLGFESAKKYSSNTILQLDDDFKLCNDFLNKLLDIYFNKKNEDNKIICISFHLYDKNHLNEKRWNLNFWVDGGGLYDINFIKKINYKIDEISINRWNSNKNLSTGVWLQISKKINLLGCKIFKTTESLVFHLGLSESKMQNTIHDNDSMKTFNYIDNI